MAQRVFKWSFILGLSLLGLSVWQTWSWWSWASAPPQLLASSTANQTAEAKPVQITIAPGTATHRIGRYLEAAGLIRSSKAWDLWARWLHWQDSNGGFKAGTYQLSASQPLSKIAQEIWQGNVVERDFTIPEGWSLRQMGAKFEAQNFFPAKDFLAAASQINSNQHPWLPANLPNLEGFFIPRYVQTER